jgi:hypothetical protein
MLSFQELHCILKAHFQIDKRHLDCLVQVLLTIITVRTMNLVELAQAMITGAIGLPAIDEYKYFSRNLKDLALTA